MRAKATTHALLGCNYQSICSGPATGLEQSGSPDDSPRNLPQPNESGDHRSCAIQTTRKLLLLSNGAIGLRRASHGAHCATARHAHFTHNGSGGSVWTSNPAVQLQITPGNINFLSDNATLGTTPQRSRFSCEWGLRQCLDEDRGQLQGPQHGRLLHRAQHRFGIQRRLGLGPPDRTAAESVSAGITSVRERTASAPRYGAESKSED